MRVSEYLVKKLEELGITDIFGVAGDYNFNILDAVEKNPQIHWIGCTNELNAGYAADGYARLKGYGALLTTYGAGELSAVNAVAGSFAENVSVINIVGMPESKHLEAKTILHHSFGNPNPEACKNIYENITEALSILSEENSKTEIDRVLKAFVKYRRPVYIGIPSDIAQKEIADECIDYEWKSDRNILEDAAGKIIEKIKNSENPVILGDILVKRYDALIEFREFAEKSGLPVTNFAMGTNLINFDYEKYLGTYFGDFENKEAKKAAETTDCLIAVGPVYSDVNSFGFRLPYDINSQIAIYGTYTYIDGVKYDNIKMSELLEALSGRIEHREVEVTNPIPLYGKAETAKKKISSKYIFSRLQEFLGENNIFIAETGTVLHGAFSMKFVQSVEVLTQPLWASIGWATAAALGAGIAKQGAKVVLLTGDGAHLISAIEVGNMLRYGIKPVIIVVNNGGYTLERLISEKPDAEFNNIADLNYARFARSFNGDIWATKVETSDDFDKALRVTQIMNKLCYIEVCTDRMDTSELTGKVFNNNYAPPEEEGLQEPPNTGGQMLFANRDIKFETTVHESLRLEDEEDINEENGQNG